MSNAAHDPTLSVSSSKCCVLWISAWIHLASCYATMPFVLKTLKTSVITYFKSLQGILLFDKKKSKINENLRGAFFYKAWIFFPTLLRLHCLLRSNSGCFTLPVTHCRHPCKQVIFITQSCSEKGKVRVPVGLGFWICGRPRMHFGNNKHVMTFNYNHLGETQHQRTS